MTNHYKFRILLGFLLASFIIYNRLFRHREERLLYTSYDFWKLCFYIFICSSMIFLCIYYSVIFYFYIKNIDRIASQNKFIVWIKNLIYYLSRPVNYILENLQIFDTYWKNNMPDYDDTENYASKITGSIGIYLEKYTKITIFIGISLIMLCQIIVLSCFIYDIMIGKFYYFYKLLWILIIPLIIRYIIYSIRIYTTANLEHLNANVYVYLWKDSNPAMTRITLEMQAILEKTGSNEHHNKYVYALSPEKLQQEPDLDPIATILDCRPMIAMFCSIDFYIFTWEKAKQKYLWLFNSVKYLIYSCCWLYLIYLLL